MDSILTKINEASLKFLTPLSSDEMYKTIVEEGRKLIDAEHGSIFLEEQSKLHRVYASSPLFFKVHITNDGYVYKAFKDNTSFVGNAATLLKRYPRIDKLGIKSVIFVPLSYKKETIGVLAMYSTKKEQFSKKEINILKLFGSMASLAIKKTQLYDETKQALDIRDRFISLASHELRTPLTSINGYIQLLYSRLTKTDTVEAKWVKELQSESVRLTNLVKELLEINRVKAGELQFTLRECNFREVVERAVERYTFSFPERKIILENKLTNQHEMVIGDFDKLLQVLSSVLSNATKFSPPKSPIHVSLSYDDPSILLQIKDAGKGIKNGDIPRIFEGFYKDLDNYHEGMGVGLLLAKHIIKYHQGTIQVRSVVGKGTIVEIQLNEAVIEA
ncbi:MAG: GAF domain-containing sensor histidine kinase [Candidatus Levybacteria bacterium]|nr:GAF domain-containing sensor histidine kinase [Candidatus Levybacteria bacterium]